MSLLFLRHSFRKFPIIGNREILLLGDTCIHVGELNDCGQPSDVHRLGATVPDYLLWGSGYQGVCCTGGRHRVDSLWHLFHGRIVDVWSGGKYTIDHALGEYFRGVHSAALLAWRRGSWWCYLHHIYWSPGDPGDSSSRGADHGFASTPNKVYGGQMMTVDRILEATYVGSAQMLLTAMHRQLYTCKSSSGVNFAFWDSVHSSLCSGKCLLWWLLCPLGSTSHSDWGFPLWGDPL